MISNMAWGFTVHGGGGGGGGSGDHHAILWSKNEISLA